MRLGLCCVFVEAPIKFRRTTATALSKLNRDDGLVKLGKLAQDNADALMQALEYCRQHEIGAFRINSQILPLATHPDHRWQVHDLPNADDVHKTFRACGDYAQKHDIRLSFHPDQFVLLNSPRADVVANSIRELEYQAEVAEWVNADVINIHAGGVYGDKPAALQRLRDALDTLTPTVRSRLTLENDDRLYTSKDLIPLCRDTGTPLVYDVHHHRCLPDGLSVDEATEAALTTWNREPLFHISSPRDGWSASDPRPHHGYIDPDDVPGSWHDLGITVDIEAKAKELAIPRLQDYLEYG